MTGWSSLRTRIAASYGALVILIIAIGAVAIGVAFRSLLLEQTKASVTVVSDEVARIAESSNALGFYDPATRLEALTSKEQLDHWASPTQYVQIDTPQGYPLGKSSNMGDLTFPRLPPDGPSERFTDGRATDGSALLIYDRVFRANGRVVAIGHVGERLDIIDRVTRRARTILIVVALGASVAVVLLSIFIAGSAIDPIKRLTAEMEQIGSQRLDRRLRWRRGDEVGKLAATFDAMLDRLQDAFARERQFISDASHEFKTPLTVINSNAQLIRRWGKRDPVVSEASLDAIIGESRRLAEMVTGMLTLAKADSGDQIPKEPLALESLVVEAVAGAHERAREKNLDLRAEFSGDRSVVMGDAALLRQLLANLIDNAIKFTDAGEIVVAVRPGSGTVRIEVRDTGIGIATETADRLFDRFFRSDTSRSRLIEGTGLGLAIVRSIARVHGGIISAQARPEGGSVFAVDLPAVRFPLEEPTLTEIQ